MLAYALTSAFIICGKFVIIDVDSTRTLVVEARMEKEGGEGLGVRGNLSKVGERNGLVGDRR